MATLSKFRIDSAKIDSGEWINLADEGYDFKLKVRGFNDEYNDSKNSRMRRLSMQFGGEAKIPSAESRAALVESLINHIIIDVADLFHDDEQKEPVTIDQFRDLLRNRDYFDLVLAVLKAAAEVGTRKVAATEDAKKN